MPLAIIYLSLEALRSEFHLKTLILSNTSVLFHWISNFKQFTSTFDSCMLHDSFKVDLNHLFPVDDFLQLFFKKFKQRRVIILSWTAKFHCLWKFEKRIYNLTFFTLCWVVGSNPMGGRTWSIFSHKLHNWLRKTKNWRVVVVTNFTLCAHCTATIQVMQPQLLCIVKKIGFENTNYLPHKQHFSA